MIVLREMRRRARYLVRPVLGLAATGHFAFHLGDGAPGLRALLQSTQPQPRADAEPRAAAAGGGVIGQVLHGRDGRVVVRPHRVGQEGDRRVGELVRRVEEGPSRGQHQRGGLADRNGDRDEQAGDDSGHRGLQHDLQAAPILFGAGDVGTGAHRNPNSKDLRQRQMCPRDRDAPAAPAGCHQ